MLVVLLTHAGDIADLRRLIEWMALLDGKLDHDCLIVCDAGVGYREAMETRDEARKLFRAVRFTTNKVSVQGWKEGSYSLFKTAVKFVAEKWPQPFLIIEPDCVPMRKGWLDAVDSEYLTLRFSSDERGCKEPFFGHIYSCDKPGFTGDYMSGIAVYPPDAETRLSLPETPVHWDVANAPVMVDQGLHTPLIHHLFATRSSPPTFVEHRNGSHALTLDDIPKEAVLFHRNKDGTLIRLLKRKLFPHLNAKPKVFIQLGRFGDLIQLFPAFKYIHDTEGVKPKVIVAKEFADVLDAVSYVDPVILPISWRDIHGAKRYADQQGWKAVITQGHGDKWFAKDLFKCPNYMAAQHARTGVPLELMTKLPLVLDRRSESREATAAAPYTKPFVAVNFSSWTSPFPEHGVIMSDLKHHFKDTVDFVDLSHVRLPRVYDLLGIMDQALGTITLDTSTLHLAHACKKPYIALTVDGGAGSTPRGNCVLNIRYREILQRTRDIIATVEGWVDAAKPAFVSAGKYVIGTGYFNKSDAPEPKEFFNVWYENTMRYAAPHEVIVLGVNGGRIKDAPGEWIGLTGNLGHTHDLTNHIKPYAMCGWSAAFVTLAMLAYANECDFVFKEQDALAFGPWVQTMYYEIGSKGMLFGDSKSYACAQSIALIKHSFIPEFVRLYMETGTEQYKANECELKFARLEKEHPRWFGRFSFGCDRDRPIPYDAAVFSAQQLSVEEMEELRRRKLI